MAGVLFQIPSIVSSHNTESEARSVSHDTEDVGDDHKFHDDLNGNYGSYAIRGLDFLGTTRSHRSFRSSRVVSTLGV